MTDLALIFAVLCVAFGTVYGTLSIAEAIDGLKDVVRANDETHEE